MADDDVDQTQPRNDKEDKTGCGRSRTTAVIMMWQYHLVGEGDGVSRQEAARALHPVCM